MSRVFTRPIAVLVVLMLLAPVAAAIARPEWATQVGIDVWNLPALHEQAECEETRSGELDTEDHEIRRRIGIKEDLIQNLISGRSNLAETTAQFAILNQDYPEYMNLIRMNYSGETDLEKMAQNVIDYTLPRLTRESWFSKVSVLGRLQAELRSVGSDIPEVESN